MRAHEFRRVGTKRRWANTASPLVAVLLASVVMAACSSSAAPVAKASASPYLNKSGTGSSVLSPVTLVAPWTVSWRFNCESPSTRRPFAITATGGGSPVTVTRQTGLGGGGYKPFKTSGTFTFAVQTSCSWTLTTEKTGTSGTTTSLSTE